MRDYLSGEGKTSPFLGVLQARSIHFQCMNSFRRVRKPAEADFLAISLRRPVSLGLDALPEICQKPGLLWDAGFPCAECAGATSRIPASLARSSTDGIRDR